VGDWGRIRGKNKRHAFFETMGGGPGPRLKISTRPEEPASGVEMDASEQVNKRVQPTLGAQPELPKQNHFQAKTKRDFCTEEEQWRSIMGLRKSKSFSTSACRAKRTLVQCGAGGDRIPLANKAEEPEPVFPILQK